MLTMTVRSVLRSIRHSPGFTCGVVGLLTLGLGVNAITFGLVDRLVLSGPAGLHEPSELKRVVRHARNRVGVWTASLNLAYLDYQELLQAGHLAGAAAESQASLLRQRRGRRARPCAARHGQLLPSPGRHAGRWPLLHG